MPYQYITFVSWNVETFGDNGDQWNAARGPNYQPICDFIANVLKMVDADILAMMELRSNGFNYLPTLVASLNNKFGVANWQYDYIPGAVAAGNARPINAFAQLGWPIQAHGEGYALLWRNNPAKFTMLPTRVNMSGNPIGGTSKIGLILNGKQAVFGANGWYAAPNFDPNAPPPAPWPNLDFCIPNPVHSGDTQLTLARRPCYFVIQLANTNVYNNPAYNLFPFVVFHAPYRDRSTPWSVQLSGYSREMFQPDNTTLGIQTLTTTNQALLSGDFNIDSNDNNNVDVGAYYSIVNTFNNGGAQCNYVTPGTTQPDNYTAVHLYTNDDPRNLITGTNSTDYRWLAIDKIFWRDINGILSSTAVPGGPVLDLIRMVMKVGNTYGPLVSTGALRQDIMSFWDTVFDEGTSNLPPYPGPPKYPYNDPQNGTPAKTNILDQYGFYTGPVVPYLQDYGNFMSDLDNGYFSNARRAAEFIFDCVSDHLPVVARFRFST